MEVAQKQDGWLCVQSDLVGSISSWKGMQLDGL